MPNTILEAGVRPDTKSRADQSPTATAAAIVRLQLGRFDAELVRS